MNVMVLCGGTSSEREISLKSGAAVAEWAKDAGHTVELVDCPESEVITRDFSKCDIVMPLFHGGHGEDGTVQAALTLRGVRYTGCSPAASAICMHKLRSKELMKQFRVPTPNYISTDGRKVEDPSDDLTLKMSQLAMEFPLVVKPARSGSSVGVTVVEKAEQWDAAMIAALKEDHVVLAEEFISGREVTVAVVAGQVLPLVEIRPKKGFYDYANKYTPGASSYHCPAPVTTEVQKHAQEYAQILWDALERRQIKDTVKSADSTPESHEHQRRLRPGDLLEPLRPLDVEHPAQTGVDQPIVGVVNPNP